MAFVHDVSSRPAQTHCHASVTSLQALPTELHLAILSRLRVLDAQMLRMTSRNFYDLIPQATPTEPDELLAAEDNAYIKGLGLLYCNSCSNLRLLKNFSDDQRGKRLNVKRWRKEAKKGRRDEAGMLPSFAVPPRKTTRFCVECGCSPMTGTTLDTMRYQPGERWRQDDILYVRCARCDDCRETQPLSPGERSYTKPEHSLCTPCIPIRRAEEEAKAEDRRQQDEKWRREREEGRKREDDEDEQRAARGELPLRRCPRQPRPSMRIQAIPPPEFFAVRGSPE